MSNFSVILGTRPEVIKLAPVVHAARARGHRVRLITTGQHRDLTYPLLKFFELKPDIDLDVMSAAQELSQVSERILSGLNLHSKDLEDSGVIFIQGDTITALIGAVWGFFNRIPVAHVEAGLRTHDLNAPFPEEANRQLISRIACFHFAPTVQAAMALQMENVKLDDIFTVGNTSIDALKWALNHLGEQKLTEIQEIPLRVAQFAQEGRYIMVTAHRRESFGVGFDGICDGILGLIERVPDLRVIYPVHPNPQAKNAAERRLGSQSRILLCDPLPYVGFLALLKSAHVILTDSGGVQEEAPSLRIPILVLREKTERLEGVEAGFSKLVGTHSSRIIEATLSALNEEMTLKGENPYGDGQSAARMIKLVEERIYAN